MGEPERHPLTGTSSVHRDTAVRTSCLIATIPRSGSWLLAEGLNNTGLAGQPEEFFRPDHTRLWEDRWGLRRNADYARYIEAALRFSTTSNQVFSVKMHWYQFEWFLEQLRSLRPGSADAAPSKIVEQWLPNTRYVLLVRHNKARQAISYYRAGRTNQWFVTDEDSARTPINEENPDFGAIRWLEDSLIRHEKSWLSFFADQGIRPLTIVYEHFVNDYYGTIRYVLEWLGVSLPRGFEFLPPGLVKQSDAESEQMLAAYLEVRDSVVPPAEWRPLR